MATLMTHLRVADLFLDIIPEISPVHFVVGSIAPDCGETAQITHWTFTGEKNDIRSQDFFNVYIKNEAMCDKKSFYLGYYIHLLVDIAWWNYVWIPASVKFAHEIEEDRGIIRKIKESWRDIDYMFLYENKEFRSFKICEKTDSFPNTYLEYYPENALESMIAYMKNVFTSNHRLVSNCNAYVSYAEVDEIIIKIVSEIRNDLTKNNVPLHFAV